jgi:hypothetical protein
VRTFGAVQLPERAARGLAQVQRHFLIKAVPWYHIVSACLSQEARAASEVSFWGLFHLRLPF